MNRPFKQACLIALLIAAILPVLARHHRQAAPDSSTQQVKGSDQGGQFDEYVMSLSWSPTYCILHSQDTAQCGGKGYGFVLHGLWPQYSRGGYPHDCATSERLTPEAIAYGQNVFPSPKLIRHEWATHGTCSGMSALDFFKISDKAQASIKVPAQLQAPTKALQMPANAIARAFADANPGVLPVSSVTVTCSGPELAEVRVCLSKSLRPQACGQGVKSNCRPGNIRVPAVR
jgi:ribonuclease T2